jgi:hypothetical protein
MGILKLRVLSLMRSKLICFQLRINVILTQGIRHENSVLYMYNLEIIVCSCLLLAHFRSAFFVCFDDTLERWYFDVTWVVFIQ